MEQKLSGQILLALTTYTKLVRAVDHVSVNAHRHLSDDNLTTSQFAVLKVLYYKGPQHQSEIARKVSKSCGNITMVIDRLERRGLVRRQRRTNDRRFISVGLTGDGRELINRVFPRHAQILAEQFAHLDATELEALGQICRRLGQERSARKDEIS